MSEAQTVVDPSKAIASLTGNEPSQAAPENIETPETVVAAPSAAPDQEIDLHPQEPVAEPSAPSQDDYDKVIQESMGRKGAIDELRDKLRVQTENIGAMQEMFLEQQAADAPSDEEIFGEAVVKDPAIRYLVSKVDGLQRQFTTDRNQRIEAVQGRNRMTAQQRKVQETREMIGKAEKDFSEKHADYGQAYDHFRAQRTKLHQSRGYNEQEITQLLGQEENDLINEALHRGRNPVEDLYNMAKANGFVAPATPAPAKDYAAESAKRVGAGVKAQNIGSMAGAPTGAKPTGVMTRQEFLTNIPKPERMRILADPDKFEELAKTGNITLR